MADRKSAIRWVMIEQRIQVYHPVCSYDGTQASETCGKTSFAVPFSEKV
jgi:hypothetical protein